MTRGRTGHVFNRVQTMKNTIPDGSEFGTDDNNVNLHNRVRYDRYGKIVKFRR